MSEAESTTGPFDDVRELALRPSVYDAEAAQYVHDALLGMGREGDFGRLGDGAAWLAGSRAGVWPNKDEFAARWQLDKRFSPQMDAETRKILLTGWRDAVNRTRSDYSS